MHSRDEDRICLAAGELASAPRAGWAGESASPPRPRSQGLGPKPRPRKSHVHLCLQLPGPWVISHEPPWPMASLWVLKAVLRSISTGKYSTQEAFVHVRDSTQVRGRKGSQEQRRSQKSYRGPPVLGDHCPPTAGNRLRQRGYSPWPQNEGDVPKIKISSILMQKVLGKKIHDEQKSTL